jgi:hypothetical protein
MASSNKITSERIDHGVLPKKKNRIHRRGLARQSRNQKRNEGLTAEAQSSQSSEGSLIKLLPRRTRRLRGEFSSRPRQSG